MQKKERIIFRYLNQRWYKKALVITHCKQDYFNRLNALKMVVCSGYLKECTPLGCVFDIGEWPFEHKFFDLVIIDNAIENDSKEIKWLLEQLHFCLSDDGEVVVACSDNIRLYNLVSKFLANGFIGKKIRLINYTNNFIINTFKKLVSKNFVVIFKKDTFFTVDALKVQSLVKSKVKNKAYSSGCAKEIYGNLQKKD